MLELQDGTRKSDKLQLLIRICIKPTNKLVSSLFGALLMLGQATGDFGLTRFTTARTRGKPPPSPIQHSLRFFVAPTFEWFFILRLPRGSPETISIWTLVTLWGYNSLLKPPIEMRFEANLQLSSIAFQRCVAHHLHAPRSG